MQISLGHAHSLVLCNDNLLYVFGCNLFGQLGQRLASAADQKTLKSSVPLLIDLTPDPITHIHTKFFANVSLILTFRLMKLLTLIIVVH